VAAKFVLYRNNYDDDDDIVSFEGRMNWADELAINEKVWLQNI
jgi:hypothetical protein